MKKMDVHIMSLKERREIMGVQTLQPCGRITLCDLLFRFPCQGLSAEFDASFLATEKDYNDAENKDG